MPDKPATLLGKIYILCKEWLIKKYSRPRFDKFIAWLPPAERIIWTKTLVPVSRVPASDYVRMSRQIIEFFGQGNPEVFKEAAAAVAFNDLSTTMKFFMRLGTPGFVASRFATLYKHYFDTGEGIALKNQDNRHEMEIRGAEAYGLTLCLACEGWGKMALEYAGGRKVQVSHPECLHQGGERCLFIYTWE